MISQRRRRWPIIETTVCKRLKFAGIDPGLCKLRLLSADVPFSIFYLFKDGIKIIVNVIFLLQIVPLICKIDLQYLTNCRFII